MRIFNRHNKQWLTSKRTNQQRTLCTARRKEKLSRKKSQHIHKNRQIIVWKKRSNVDIAHVMMQHWLTVVHSPHSPLIQSLTLYGVEFATLFLFLWHTEEIARKKSPMIFWRFLRQTLEKKKTYDLLILLFRICQIRPVVCVLSQFLLTNTFNFGTLIKIRNWLFIALSQFCFFVNDNSDGFWLLWYSGVVYC